MTRLFDRRLLELAEILGRSDLYEQLKSIDFVQNFKDDNNCYLHISYETKTSERTDVIQIREGQWQIYTLDMKKMFFVHKNTHIQRLRGLLRAFIDMPIIDLFDGRK